jgi:hypothetical protein
MTCELSIAIILILAMVAVSTFSCAINGAAVIRAKAAMAVRREGTRMDMRGLRVLRVQPEDSDEEWLRLWSLSRGATRLVPSGITDGGVGFEEMPE